jgi:hypothetical protein
VVTHEERINADEVVHVGRLAVTSPARTFLDLGRHLERDTAVALIDALAHTTGLTVDDITSLVHRYRCTRGTYRN